MKTIQLYNEGCLIHQYESADEESPEFIYHDHMVYEYSHTKNDTDVYFSCGFCRIAK